MKNKGQNGGGEPTLLLCRPQKQITTTRRIDMQNTGSHTAATLAILGTRTRATTGKERKAERSKKTYNTRDSLVVTDPTTSLALGCLSNGERTGSRVFS
ncbi:hypothetical protein B0T26DRAFT_863190 [Lasiosphaeria miniovina]|uniref:Uncharacterized protein n=1 Tax=Lasiosphaeria miniovina TaxID=1954250 RepID=A0AA39ZZZ5_9PEZI|nr:uncharacterized protein B0T26DRAFT_863190 [Lasiosphaeria miniovina]KAK0706787.1 hypothetical protein B0T26DRAFT_863190 [Lasiosphaeria miniovina]